MRSPLPSYRLTVLLVAAVTGLAGLTSCSGSGSPSKPAVSPATHLARAKAALDATSGVRIGLSTPKLPSGVSGLLGATGIGTHAPAFDGSIKVSATGVTADAAVVAVGGTVYAKLPFTTTFVKIDPADYSAPDPASLLAKDGGLSSLLTAATGVKKGKQERSGKVVLTGFTATVPGKAVARVIPSASPGAAFAARFTLTSGDRLSQAVLTGPFYPRADDVTYTISFDDYGTKKNITAP
jgi:lipoprotein LprG